MFVPNVERRKSKNKVSLSKIIADYSLKMIIFADAKRIKS